MNIDQSSLQENIKELSLYRKLLVVAGSVYFIWWFAVELLFPNAFNPFLSRLSVVLVIFGIWAASFVKPFFAYNLRILFVACTWLITVHYFYLFYGNAGDINWVVGSYITVIAISLGILSSPSLLAYSCFVALLSVMMVIVLPVLRDSVFLPGIATILLQANLGFRSKLKVIQDLTASNERFQLLFNSTFEGVLVHESGRIVAVNDALVQMSGYAREELIGRDPFQILHPAEREQSMEKMKTGDVVPYESKAITKAGQVLDIEIRGKDFIYDESPARLVTIQNISDRKRAEKERIAALTLADNLRIRDDFISIASHELKTPLTAMQLQIRLIERDLKKESTLNYWKDSVKQLVSLFDRQIDRLTELVDAMLDVSRMASGRLPLSVQQVNVADLVRETALNYPVQIRVPEELYLSVDPYRIQQVVENLLTNVQKYGAGKPAEVRLRQDDSEVILEVEDHGIGIGSEYRERIFDRFERAVSSRNITGFGLGLYIAKRIVEAHRGKISVKSEPGFGSTFTVQLPLR